MANILVIDDDYAMRTMYQFMFMEAGYTAQVAADGQKALEKMETFIPDLMLVDISMPVMDGVTFIKEVNKLASSRPELARIPFIVLTGEDYAKMKEHYVIGQCKECRAFLPKMTPSATVLGLVQKALAEYGKA
ncbi:MAG: response regulator [Elusimicrobiales bacterium]|nr:response regulator [Elusimicrobiales bacterium]